MILTYGKYHWINFQQKDTPGGTFIVHLQIAFSRGASNPTFQIHNAEDLGIRLVEIGERTQSWDDKEFFIGLGEMEVTLHDEKGELRNVLYEGGFEQSKSFIELWKKEGNGWIKQFAGFYNEDAEDKMDKDDVLVCTFSAQTERLNKEPIHYNNVFNDLFNGKYNFNPNAAFVVYNYKEVITDFFKLINPHMTVDWYNSWNFISAFYNGNRYTVTLDELFVRIWGLIQRQVDTTYEWTVENYMQPLKSALLGLGMFGGCISSDKAFVRSVYDYLSPSNQTTLNDSNLIDFEVKRTRRQYDYFALKTGNFVWDSRGVKSSISDYNLDISVVGAMFWVPRPGGYSSLERISGIGLGEAFWATFIKNMFANYYLNHRYYPREDYAVIKGTHFTLADSFIHKNTVYIPAELIIKDTEGITEAKLLAVGDYYDIIDFGDGTTGEEGETDGLYSNEGNQLLSSEGNILIPLPED